jgi:hypothetical protein
MTVGAEMIAGLVATAVEETLTPGVGESDAGTETIVGIETIAAHLTRVKELLDGHGARLSSLARSVWRRYAGRSSCSLIEGWCCAWTSAVSCAGATGGEKWNP